MKREFRLTQSTEILRVRRLGKSYAHPLLVLYVFASAESRTRVGVTASHAVGGAVQRNRAKRRIRACIDLVTPNVAPGWNMIVLARRQVLKAPFSEVRGALTALFNRAGVFVKEKS